MYLATAALWPALIAFLAFAAPMAITDAREFRLPLWLNLGLVGSAALLLPIASIWVGGAHLIMAAVTAVIVTVLMGLLFMLARGGLGFGDVILVAGLGAYGGFASPAMALGGMWIGCLGTLIWAITRRLRGITGPTPFGPGLIIGTALAMLIPLQTIV